LDPADSAPIVGVEGGGGGGGGGAIDKCSRGGVKLRSNAGARVNVDVEDEEDSEEEEEGDIDVMFDQPEIDEGELDESGPARPLTRSLFTHPIPEKQALSTSTTHLLSTLAGSCRAVTSSSATVFNNASNVLKSLVSGHSYDCVQPSFHNNTLLAIAHRCDLAERLVESSQFIFSLNLIQFRTKIEW
jgi:hypothetical protein